MMGFLAGFLCGVGFVIAILAGTAIYYRVCGWNPFPW